MRRFFLRHLPLAAAGVLALLAITVTGLYFLASSAKFENLVREHLVKTLDTGVCLVWRPRRMGWLSTALRPQAKRLMPRPDACACN
jgi:hypothetical protein